MAYAYQDQYGISHVTDDISTAQQYSGNGNISNYSGNYGGGYALDSRGNAMSLPGSTYNSPNLVAYDSNAGQLSAVQHNLSNSNSLASQNNLAQSYLSGNKIDSTLNGLIPAGVGGVGGIGISQADQDLIAEAQRVWNLPNTTQAQKDELNAFANKIRDKNGLAGQYDRTTGALYPGATAKAASYDSSILPTKLEYDVPMPTAPNLNIQPYSFDETQYKAIDSGMTWLPTLNAKKAWYDQENQRVGNLQNAYTNSLKQWQSGADQWNTEQTRALQLQQMLLPYNQLTAAQQAELDWSKDPTNPANVYKVAQAEKTSSGTTRSGKSTGGGQTTVTDNPFASDNSSGNSNMINGYETSRLDAKIEEIAAKYSNDPNKVLAALQNSTLYRPNYKNALIKRLKERAGG